LVGDTPANMWLFQSKKAITKPIAMMMYLLNLFDLTVSISILSLLYHLRSKIRLTRSNQAD
jgi:Na+/H+ antiporter NhaD/arsenite permease-like protein